MILARRIRGQQWPASFESPSYTGNNLPDSLCMNEWPSAARPKKARHLNDKGPEGHPLLYYCKFIAAFLCDSLSKKTQWVFCRLRGQQAKETLQEGGKDYGEEKVRWIRFLCWTIQSALKKHSFLPLCDWANTEPPFRDLFTWNKQSPNDPSDSEIP